MKTLNKNYIFWGFVLAFYALFIFVFSYLYPYGADEYSYARSSHDIISAVKSYFHSYLFLNPRIGLLINNIILLHGKWLFLLLNPIIQTTLIVSFFGLLYTRLPNFKSLKDLPVFILIAVMSTIFIAKPDNTIFWLGGAANYSWSILPFIWLLTFLKYVYERKAMPQLNNFYNIIIFFIAIFLGMTNENNAPAALLAMLCFIPLCKKLKIKITPLFSVILIGLILGLACLFLAPGSYERINIPLIQYFKNASLMTKIFWHIPKMNDMIISLLFVPLLIPFLMLTEFYSKRMNVFNNNDFIYSLLSLIMAFILASVLCMAPIMGTTRPFYSASVMTMISFIFLLKYFDETYKLKLIYYASYLAFIIFVIILPLFAMPYISLYRQDKARMDYINKAKAEGKDKVYLAYFIPTGGISNNLRLLYYDVAKHNNVSQFLDIKVEIISPKSINITNMQQYLNYEK